MEYNVQIVVPKETALRIKKALAWREGNDPRDRLGANEVVRFTAHFSNGLQADIKCCGVDYEPYVDDEDKVIHGAPYIPYNPDQSEGDKNSAWSEMVLFTGDGFELGYTEPSEEFFGRWTIEEDGNIYNVDVVEENTDGEPVARCVHDSNDHAIIDEPIKLELEYIGEGYNGDYDISDPEDEQLLRLTVWVRESAYSGAPVSDDSDADDWIECDGCSVCTLISTTTEIDTIERLLHKMLDTLKPAILACLSGEATSWRDVERLCADISWWNDAMV